MFRQWRSYRPRIWQRSSAVAAPGELLWTLAGRFDSQAQQFTRVHWFHTHDEAVAWIDAGSPP
jgi:hypothetical protein